MDVASKLSYIISGGAKTVCSGGAANRFRRASHQDKCVPSCRTSRTRDEDQACCHSESRTHLGPTLPISGLGTDTWSGYIYTNTNHTIYLIIHGTGQSCMMRAASGLPLQAVCTIMRKGSLGSPSTRSVRQPQHSHMAWLVGICSTYHH